MKRDPKTKLKYIFGIVDSFSRKLWAVALPSKRSSRIVDYLQKVFKGQYFQLWQADNGGEFISKLMKSFIESVGGKEIHSAPRHPQTNGKIERIWSTLKSKLRSVSTIKNKLTAQLIGTSNEWSQHLDAVVDSYNNTVHSSTQMTPNFIETGSHPHLENNSNYQAIQKFNNPENLPVEKIREIALDSSRRAAIRNEERWNKKGKVEIFEVGDKVWVKDDSKKKATIKYPWIATIVRRYNNYLYQVRWGETCPPGQEPNEESVYAIATRRLKRALLREPILPIESSSSESEEENFLQNMNEGIWNEELTSDSEEELTSIRQQEEPRPAIEPPNVPPTEEPRAPPSSSQEENTNEVSGNSMDSREPKNSSQALPTNSSQKVPTNVSPEQKKRKKETWVSREFREMADGPRKRRKHQLTDFEC
jgi:hypothetical protein